MTGWGRRWRASWPEGIHGSSAASTHDVPQSHARLDRTRMHRHPDHHSPADAEAETAGDVGGDEVPAGGVSKATEEAQPGAASAAGEPVSADRVAGVCAGQANPRSGGSVRGARTSDGVHP